MTLPTTITGLHGAPAVLFLHGFMGAAEDWHAVTAELADAYCCVAVDLPGHGSATGLPDEAYSFDGTLDLIAATLDALGLERVRVVGYSMGARLGLAFTLMHAGVARLVLESGSPGLKTEAQRAARRAVDEGRAAEIEADFGAFLEAWSRQPLFALADRPEARAAFIAQRRRNNPAELARSLRGSGTGQQPSLWPDLACLAAPTLAVAGGRDPKYVDLAFEIAVAGPPAMPLVVPAGHAIHAEQPALFASLVRSFLSDPISTPQLAL